MDCAKTRIWLASISYLVSLLTTCLVVSHQSACAETSGNSKINTRPKGTVYIVLAVDTEPLHISGAGKRFELDLSNFLPDSSSIVARVMSAAWRARYIDSFGGYPKFTWFIMTSEHICQASDCATVFDAMQQFREAIVRFGDEIGWHYHHTDWEECTSAGKIDSAWTQLVTFNGTEYSDGTDVELCENVLNHLVADRSFFPVSFRSGWVWENNDFSRWLEYVVPFDLSSSPPIKTITGDSSRCRANESDWSRAPSHSIPYHPDTADYQVPGTMKRFISRSLVKTLSTSDFKMLSAVTDSGHSAILSLPIHSYSNLRFVYGQRLDEIIEYLNAYGTSFKFATCAEAFQPFIGNDPSKPLKLELRQQGRLIAIEANVETFSPQPYVVLRTSTGMLKRVLPRKTGKGSWMLDLGKLDVAEVYVAESTVAGESVVRSIVVSPQ